VRESSDIELFSALAFKTATDHFVGTLTFTCVYSDAITTPPRGEMSILVPCSR
jgi:translation elongation factor EF-G